MLAAPIRQGSAILHGLRVEETPKNSWPAPRRCRYAIHGARPCRLRRVAAGHMLGPVTRYRP
eukprot:700698-Lingulodinium_polyedra.AAC.1